jgi:hypothetical protein
MILYCFPMPQQLLTASPKNQYLLVMSKSDGVAAFPFEDLHKFLRKPSCLFACSVALLCYTLH